MATAPKDGDGVYSTNPADGSQWVLVYDGDTFVTCMESNGNQTSSRCVVETFSSESAMESRMSDLGLSMPEEEPDDSIFFESEEDARSHLESQIAG